MDLLYCLKKDPKIFPFYISVYCFIYYTVLKKVPEALFVCLCLVGVHQKFYLQDQERSRWRTWTGRERTRPWRTWSSGCRNWHSATRRAASSYNSSVASLTPTITRRNFSIISCVCILNIVKCSYWLPQVIVKTISRFQPYKIEWDSFCDHLPFRELKNLPRYIVVDI